MIVKDVKAKQVLIIDDNIHTSKDILDILNDKCGKDANIQIVKNSSDIKIKDSDFDYFVIDINLKANWSNVIVDDENYDNGIDLAKYCLEILPDCIVALYSTEIKKYRVNIRSLRRQYKERLIIIEKKFQPEAII